MRTRIILKILLALSVNGSFGTAFEIVVPESTEKIGISSATMHLRLQFEVPLVTPEAPGTEHWRQKG
jgi:hypothetical protein